MNSLLLLWSDMFLQGIQYQEMRLWLNCCWEKLFTWIGSVKSSERASSSFSLLTLHVYLTTIIDWSTWVKRCTNLPLHQQMIQQEMQMQDESGREEAMQKKIRKQRHPEKEGSPKMLNILHSLRSFYSTLLRFLCDSQSVLRDFYERVLLESSWERKCYRDVFSVCITDVRLLSHATTSFLKQSFPLTSKRTVDSFSFIFPNQGIFKRIGVLTASLLIHVLHVSLCIFSFFFTGIRPWLHFVSRTFYSRFEKMPLDFLDKMFSFNREEFNDIPERLFELLKSLCMDCERFWFLLPFLSALCWKQMSSSRICRCVWYTLLYILSSEIMNNEDTKIQSKSNNQNSRDSRWGIREGSGNKVRRHHLIFKIMILLHDE